MPFLLSFTPVLLVGGSAGTGELGLVRLCWERTCSVLLRSVGRSAVIYAHSKDSLNHPIFMVSPPASSLLPPRVTSCLGGL